MQWYKSYTSASSPAPGNTNAPGETNCTSCHSGSATTGSAAITLKLNGSNVMQYLPDSVYNVNINFSPGGVSKFGFQVTALIKSTGKMAGTFTITDLTKTQRTTTTISGSTREYVMHTSSGTGSSSWNFNWKAPSSNIGDIVFYVSANAANGNGNNSGDAIHVNEFTLIPSTKLPVATIGAPASVCLGDSVSFTGSGTNTPLKYKWTFTGGTPATSTLQNPKVLYTKAGAVTARLTVTNFYGVSKEVTKSVTIKASPSDTVNVAGSTSFCSGDSVKLTATPGIKYLWNTGQATQSIYAKTSGDYSVEVTNAGSCTVKSKTVSIKVFDKPVVSLSRTYGNDIMCQGDSVVLEASAGAGTYNFYDGNTLLSSDTLNIYTFKNIAPGQHTYYVLATDTNGCPADTTQKFAVNVTQKLAAPALSCGTATTGSVTVNWATINGAASYDVSTDGGTNWSNTTITSFTKNGLNADENVEIKVRAVDNTVCQFGNTATVNCKSLPCSELTYTLQYDSVVCEGNNAVVTFGNFSSKTYAISLTGSTATKDTVFTFAPTSDSVITFSLVDSTKLNCAPIQHSIKLIADKLPTLEMEGNNLTYCAGDLVTITMKEGYEKYDFYKNDDLMQSSSGRSLIGVFNNDDKIQVIAHTARGCQKTSAPMFLTIIERTNPGFSYISDKLTVTFTDTTKQAVSRRWNFGDDSTSTDVITEHTYTEEGQYTVWLVTTNRDGCSDSVSKVLDVRATGIQELIHMRELNIYPNPFRSLFTVAIDLKEASKTQLQLFDLKGKVVINMQVQTKSGKNEIRIPAANLPAGIYMLRLQSANETINKKLIKTTVAK